MGHHAVAAAAATAGSSWFSLSRSSADASLLGCSSSSPSSLSCPLPLPPFFGHSGRHRRSAGFISPHQISMMGPPGVFRCRIRKGSDMMSELELGRPEERRIPNRRVNGIFWILLLNIGIYVADHIFQLREIKALYLYHSWPSWYQFVTSTFCHANWNHLSSNLFFLYIFGKLVEEEEGNFALWLSYILTGAGANLVSWLVLPRAAVSVGASGAVFGLFAISVLVKMSWDWRKILEVLILGQFVIDKGYSDEAIAQDKAIEQLLVSVRQSKKPMGVQVMEAAQASTGLAGPAWRGSSLQTVNHIAHLSGALIGVALVLLLSRIPSQASVQDAKPLRGDKDTSK